MSEPKRATIKAANGKAEIWLYGEIGEDWWGGISADAFVSDLRALTADEITIYFASEGGDAFDAFAMYSQLRQHPARVIGQVDSIAASAAAHVLCACDEIVMAANSVVVIHNPWTGAIGDYRDFATTTQRLTEMRDRLSETIVARMTDQTTEQVNEMLDAETWLWAEQAIDLGLADRQDPALNVAAKIDFGRFQNVPEQARARFEARAHQDPEPKPVAWRRNLAARRLQMMDAAIAGLPTKPADPPQTQTP